MRTSKKTDSTKTKKQIDTQAKADLIVQVADDMKAQRIENIDVRKKTSVTSRMVVVSGTSETHIRSITEKVYDKLREQGIKPQRKDPGPGGGWLILDYGDVVFHAMLEEKRQFYDLETLWNTMQPNPDLIE
jgi:ribosome-associated protein